MRDTRQTTPKKIVSRHASFFVRHNNKLKSHPSFRLRHIHEFTALKKCHPKFIGESHSDNVTYINIVVQCTSSFSESTIIDERVYFEPPPNGCVLNGVSRPPLDYVLIPHLLLSIIIILILLQALRAGNDNWRFLVVRLQRDSSKIYVRNKKSLTSTNNNN